MEGLVGWAATAKRQDECSTTTSGVLLLSKSRRKSDQAQRSPGTSHHPSRSTRPKLATRTDPLAFQSTPVHCRPCRLPHPVWGTPREQWCHARPSAAAPSPPPPKPRSIAGGGGGYPSSAVDVAAPDSSCSMVGPTRWSIRATPSKIPASAPLASALASTLDWAAESLSPSLPSAPSGPVPASCRPPCSVWTAASATPTVDVSASAARMGTVWVEASVGSALPFRCEGKVTSKRSSSVKSAFERGICFDSPGNWPFFL
mmetsp:Transcript_2558/g.5611  ORF Transcript_2558/g.5611 Transcript_2558/m.5611 type:complete len:258 (-) Transcript_2558:45-818(-)